MTKSRLQGRAALAGVIATVCALGACDSVLDIEDPKVRPDTSGEAGAAGDNSHAGKAAGTAGSSDGNRTPGDGGAGGEAGTSTVPPITLGGAGSGGEGGEAPQGECTPKAARCTDKAPEICDETGHWVHNAAESAGDCSVLCDTGKCVQCQAPAKRCAVCADDAQNCNSNQPQTCVDGAWKNDGNACKNYCDAGVCVTPPSCSEASGVAAQCDGGKTSCCNSRLVPGGNFFRDYDGTEEYSDKSFPAGISPFYLDKFEVTVGRMRNFINGYDQLNLKDGDGMSSHIPNDVGWDTHYSLPNDKAALIESLKSCDDATWTDKPAENLDLPINCVQYNVAYAFCIWDGGRLPTEAEWNFAAAGGDEQRAYPWPTPDTGPTITSDHSNYGASMGRPLPVGGRPLGNARWGQTDLGGNVGEWTLDYSGDYPAQCQDCLNLTTANERTWRGGAYDLPADFARTSIRATNEPASGIPEIGFRCARDQH